jgi:hypothetical protein
MTKAAPKKQVAKTLYLDAGTLEALEYLKSRRPEPGLRFSVPLFFSDFSTAGGGRATPNKICLLLNI